MAKKPDALQDRRFMVAYVPLEQVGAILMGEAKLVLDNRPEDLRIIRLRSNFLRDTLDIVIASLEFPVVPGNVDPPDYDGPYHVQYLKD